MQTRLVMTIMFKDVEAVSKKARQDDDLGTEHLQVTRVHGPSQAAGDGIGASRKVVFTQTPEHSDCIAIAWQLQ